MVALLYSVDEVSSPSVMIVQIDRGALGVHLK